MKAIINNTLLSQLQPKDKQYDVWDTKLTGFILRVYPSGKMVYRCEYARGKRFTIGKAGALTPMQARDRAKEILADAIKGINPAKSKNIANNTPILRTFIENDYRHWVEAHRKTGKQTLARLKTQFIAEFGNKSLNDVTPLHIEKWRSERLKAGIKPATVNRDIVSLKAAFSKAVEWEIIKEHPLSKLRPVKTDALAKIRYLTKEEEIALRQAIDCREEEMRIARDSANAWRKERGYEEFPDLRSFPFVDYMKPMILLSLNTGLRRGELLDLRWEHVNFSMATITILGETAKSGKTRHIPLNTEALDSLQRWHEQSSQDGLVFLSKEGKRLNTIKKAWASILKRAKITNFRWHDLRHHFASRLVMAGVDLNTVRELLGHSDIKMTLRYAHLAPEHKANAVAKLVTPIT